MTVFNLMQPKPNIRGPFDHRAADLSAHVIHHKHMTAVWLMCH